MTYDPSNIFFRILSNEAPCVRVWETGQTLAFMDVMPQADGHVLVIPKEAASTIFDLSEEAAAACIASVQHVARAVRIALCPDGLLIAQLNGEAAGQTVGHVHFHVIPRWKGIPLRPHGKIQVAADELEAVAQRIRLAL
ncbi:MULTISPECIES: HIT family protein [Burkholderia cepacia complex]|jgi:histidine triad (HIT) family protein|uniref:HIT family protein n=1 Tax=Burkholderia vietnamiensis TaxID=60552 RepID=A0AAW7T7V3_BURVI|nr:MULTISPECIES: HIT family protein [Burkholderia cepacia complex]MDN7799407.1 HIT family protein [Burkholderia vietnamiensis]